MTAGRWVSDGAQFPGYSYVASLAALCILPTCGRLWGKRGQLRRGDGFVEGCHLAVDDFPEPRELRVDLGRQVVEDLILLPRGGGVGALDKSAEPSYLRVQAAGVLQRTLRLALHQGIFDLGQPLLYLPRAGEDTLRTVPAGEATLPTLHLLLQVADGDDSVVRLGHFIAD